MIARLTAAAALAAALALPAAAQTAPAQGARPSLVVFITVDQLRPDYFARYQHQLTGGLARLARNGAFYRNGMQDHAITETAPGHASTLSGRFPASTGIVANVYGVGDTTARLLTGTMMGASPFRFRGTTLIDWMRAANPASRALSISRKDRGAILPLGRAKQSVFWYDYQGGFTTSRYYADTLPAWVRRFNARRIPHGMAGREWNLLLPAGEYPEPDTVLAESRTPIARGAHEPAFPHRIPTDPDSAARYFTEFPFMDQLTADAAITGLREMRLGRGDHPDLLAVSFSTTDAVGHRYGPDSREIHDQVLRLDRTLGAFIDSVYAQVDSSRVVFALTADHGVASLPEVAHPGASRGWHVSLDTLVVAMRNELGAGVDPAAFLTDDGILFLRPELLPRGVNADSLARAFAARVRRVPGVHRVDRMADLWALGPEALERDSIGRRWVHMIPRDQPIPVVVTLDPGRDWGTGLYAVHGTPHAYDVHVPVIFYGPAFRPGRHDEPVRVVDMAPTLAAILGIRPLEALDGRVVASALR
ncbi:MAG TPA: alkaline phosphatase family protein [Longimicrobium sp.]|jgi:arylsulfatase A-like enzyme|uniref:alkaline phosphatase family protein n=1 Tax=Longimicrobium sp. TaxID=2029185 RepID=UPI002ED83CBA